MWSLDLCAAQKKNVKNGTLPFACQAIAYG